MSDSIRSFGAEHIHALQWLAQTNWRWWPPRASGSAFAVDRRAGAAQLLSLASLTFMWQNYIFGMHWKHGDKMYYDELSAESKDKAAGYFIDNCRDDVSLVRVVPVRPDDGGVRELAHSPYSPFDPLKAKRRTDIDEDAR